MTTSSSQQHAAGLFAAPNNARARESSVPHCGGLDAANAVALVRAAGLRPAPTSADVTAEDQHGHVVGQEPGPEAIVPRGAIVTLFIGAASAIDDVASPADEVASAEPVLVTPEPASPIEQSLEDLQDDPIAGTRESRAPEERVDEHPGSAAPEKLSMAAFADGAAAPRIESVPTREPSIVDLPRLDRPPSRSRRGRMLAVTALVAVIVWAAVAVLGSSGPAGQPTPAAPASDAEGSVGGAESPRSERCRRARPARRVTPRVRAVATPHGAGRRGQRSRRRAVRPVRRGTAAEPAPVPAPPLTQSAAPRYYAPAPPKPDEFF